MGRIEEMKQMIQDEIQAISKLEERIIFKELIENVFLTLYETNEEMYRSLENRVLDELAYDINRYGIMTGLIEANYVDQSHHLFTAVCEEDLTSHTYTVGEIRKKLAVEGKMRLTTLFLQCDFMEIKKFFEQQKYFSGIIETKKQFGVKVLVEPSKRYLDEIEHLYHLFMKNGIPWSTVNAPYLFKMADAYITELPKELRDDETVVELKADFGKYNPFVQYNMVPIWNIRRLQLKSVGFPVACRDHENYEHVISLQDYGTEHTFLVEDRKGIQKVRQTSNQLVITGKIADSRKWDVYMVRNSSSHKADRFIYPTMGNLRKDGFAERFHQHTAQSVKTKGELERFINGYHLEDYLKYQDCALEDKEKIKHESYSMNFFIRDEIRGKDGKKQMTLYFKPGEKEQWLLRDIMSFICSEVQELYPEYSCGGVLI